MCRQLGSRGLTQNGALKCRASERPRIPSLDAYRSLLVVVNIVVELVLNEITDAETMFDAV